MIRDKIDPKFRKGTLGEIIGGMSVGSETPDNASDAPAVLGEPAPKE